MEKRLNVPNAITMSRIVALPFLFGLVIFDFRFAFLIVYLMVGSTDAFDGFFARKLNQVTDFGKMLDSLADLMFYVSSAWFLYKLYPEYLLPNANLLIAFFSLLALSFVVSGILLKKPIMMHTSILRFNAIMVYLLIVSSYFLNTTYFVTFILVLYIIGFIEEILIFIKYGEVDPDTKSILSLIRSTDNHTEEIS